MAVRDAVILVRDADQPMGVNHYRAELWCRPYVGHLVAMTRWLDTRALALKDARRCFPTFTVQDE